MPKGQDTRNHPKRQVGPQTSTGGSGTTPPKKPGTKTGGYGDNEQPPRKPFEYQESYDESRENRYSNGWYN